MIPVANALIYVYISPFIFNNIFPPILNFRKSPHFVEVFEIKTNYHF